MRGSCFLLLLALTRPALAGEPVLLLDGSPGSVAPEPRAEVLGRLQRALEQAGYPVQRQAQPTAQEEGPAVDTLLARAKTQSEQFKEQQALKTLEQAEAAFRAGFGPHVEVRPLIRVLLARARLLRDLDQQSSADEQLHRALVLDPQLRLDPGLFPPSLVQRSKLLRTRLGLPVPLSVTTTPAGQRVWVDGRARGTAPLRLQLVPGEHFLAAGQPGATLGQALLFTGEATPVALTAPGPATDPELRRLGRQQGAGWIAALQLQRQDERYRVLLRLLAARGAQPPRALHVGPVARAGLRRSADRLAAQLLQTLRTAALVSGAAQPLPGPRHDRPRSIWRRWWFWAAVVAVVGGGTAAAVLLTRDSDPGVRVTLER